VAAPPPSPSAPPPPSSPSPGRLVDPGPLPPPPGRFKRLARKIWWLHSGFALTFGVGVMLFARHGLAYADKLLLVLSLSWLLMFVALRFIVGPANRAPDEKLLRKGLRLGTNYLIKQLYQQMFFFLVPLYASSATWSLSSVNWWLAPVLLVCAVVSTMDLVFDNVIMERSWLAATMYGLAMFGLLNVALPLVFGFDHAVGLILAALATPPSVALLTFSVRSVLAWQGLAATLGATAGLVLAVMMWPAAIPPAPLALTETTVGSGTRGSHECMPSSAHVIPRAHLDAVRCGSWLVEPGGVKDQIVHDWYHRGERIAHLYPQAIDCVVDGEGVVLVSELPPDLMPADPTGHWRCVTRTVHGQLVGLRDFRVVAAAPSSAWPFAVDAGVAGADAGVRHVDARAASIDAGVGP
jgi:hypothetical protein